MSRIDKRGSLSFSFVRGEKEMPFTYPAALLETRRNTTTLQIGFIAIGLRSGTEAWIVDSIEPAFACMDLRPGDELLALNKVELTAKVSPADLAQLVADANDMVNITLRREGKKRSLRIETSKRSEFDLPDAEILMNECLDGSCTRVDWEKLGIALKRGVDVWTVAFASGNPLNLKISPGAQLIAVNDTSVSANAALSAISTLSGAGTFRS